MFASRLSAAPIGVPGLYDSEMWTMDVRWAPPRDYSDTSGAGMPRMAATALRPSTKAMWASFVTCTRVAEVGGGWISQPWSVTGQAACRNPAGELQHPKCPWGIWRLPTCTAESISFAWQGQRYLWAQGKMRELLTMPPTRATAAQWVWSAYQLISLLHWSTNVRFGNPQSRMFDYARELESAGCIWPGFGGFDGGRHAGQLVSRYGADAALTSRAYGAVTALRIANWNRVAESEDNPVDPARGPGLKPPLVPLSRGDFSPWFELPDVLGNAAPSAALEVQAQQRALVGTRRGWSRTLALRGADPDAPMPTFVTWMSSTWGAMVVDVLMPPPNPSRASYNVQLPGAAKILEATRAALEHYSSVPFLKWQTTILNVYSLEMQPFTATLPGAQQLAFSRSIADFAGRAQALQSTQWNRGEAAQYTVAAMSLIVSLVSAPAAAVLGIMFELLGRLVSFLGDQGLLASGFSVCPAFPFLRVPDPPCDALGAPVDAVGLPIDPPPGPVRLTREQIALLQDRSRAGTLTPSQQALLTRPLILAPSPAKKSNAVVGIGIVALLALLFGRR